MLEDLIENMHMAQGGSGSGSGSGSPQDKALTDADQEVSTIWR